MASLEDKLSTLLQQTGTNAKKQDRKILLYNRQLEHVSKGVLVEDLTAAVRLTTGYLSHLRTNGFTSLLDWAKDHQVRPVPFKEVVNRVDPQSAYYVQALSSVSRINLLKAAKELTTRVRTAQALRKDSPVTESDQRRYLKIKKIAAIYRADSEKVV